MVTLTDEIRGLLRYNGGPMTNHMISQVSRIYPEVRK